MGGVSDGGGIGHGCVVTIRVADVVGHGIGVIFVRFIVICNILLNIGRIQMALGLLRGGERIVIGVINGVDNGVRGVAFANIGGVANVVGRYG